MDIYFFSGGEDDTDNVRNDILEFDPQTEKWAQIGTMREARRGPGVSVVDFKDYADFCFE